MADNLSFEELSNHPIVPYSQLRNNLNTGDLLFCSGNYEISKAIRTLTDSVWSHVGIIYRVEALDRILILESVEDMGVRFAPLSKYLVDYKGDKKPYEGIIAVAEYTRNLSTEEIKNIIGFGMDALTKSYDKTEVLRIVGRMLLGEGKQIHNNNYICSELVWECFNKAGITLSYNPEGFISPQDIWKDSNFKLISRIL